MFRKAGQTHSGTADHGLVAWRFALHTLCHLHRRLLLRSEHDVVVPDTGDDRQPDAGEVRKLRAGLAAYDRSVAKRDAANHSSCAGASTIDGS